MPPVYNIYRRKKRATKTTTPLFLTSEQISMLGDLHPSQTYHCL
nr:MAG TPA: hypothetical protein [Bacteriophage sp.]